MRTKTILTVAVLLAGLAISAVAQAATPREIARRCVEGIESATDEAVGQMRHICQRTAQEIRVRLRDGDEEGARAAARIGVERISNVLRRTGGNIERGSRRCIDVLREMGANPKFVRAIRNAAETAVERMLDSRTACIRVIRAELRG